MTRASLYTTLLTAALAAPATAQIRAFGGDAPRMSTIQILADPGTRTLIGMLCIQYGQPEWKNQYEDMLDQAKGERFRLGKDFWTTFNTSTAVTIGDTKVPAGNYYLGIGCNEDGEFELIVLDAAKAHENSYMPSETEAWKPDYTCAMEKGESEDIQEKLKISLQNSDGDPTDMTLRIAWGNHVLTAPIEVHAGGAKDASAGKDKK